MRAESTRTTGSASPERSRRGHRGNNKQSKTDRRKEMCITCRLSIGNPSQLGQGFEEEEEEEAGKRRRKRNSKSAGSGGGGISSIFYPFSVRQTKARSQDQWPKGNIGLNKLPK